MNVRSILSIAVLASLSAVPAAAAPKGGAGGTSSGQLGWLQSENANANACFGQARGWWASTLGQGTNPYLPEGTSNGDVISDRAGDNPEENAGFIEDYCGPAE